MGLGRRRWRVIWAAGALVLAVMVTAGVAAGERHGGLPARMLSGHGMGGAVDLAENGGRVWAIAYAAHGSGSVLELNASNGRWIRTFSGGRYGFRYPDAIAAGGGHIWVANDPQTGDGQTPKPGDGSVTELNAADGSWVRTLSGRRYGFDFPGPMAVIGYRRGRQSSLDPRQPNIHHSANRSMRSIGRDRGLVLFPLPASQPGRW